MKIRSKPIPFFCLMAMLCSSVITLAQETGTISGRVVTADGSPIPNIGVYLTSGAATSGAGRSRGISRSTSSDKDGNFQFNNLPDRSYNLSHSVGKGYISAPVGQRMSRLRIGETVTLTMIKGGVITGRVTNSDGEPVVGVAVSVTRVRDQGDNRISAQTNFSPNNITDDRGIYRIYGLQPGKYIVAANAGPNFVAPAFSPYYGEAPTYHPSSTRETAAEVEVVAGGEATGIDIRYRGETGHIVSGTISGLGESARAGLTLRYAQSGGIVGYGSTQQNENESGFAIYGVPDGEYELTASYGNSETEDYSYSEPRRVTVKGADVGGLVLRMVPTANVSGRVTIEKSPTVCDGKLKFSYEEVSVSALRSEKVNASQGSPWAITGRSGSINDKGEFKINGLVPGRYRLNANLHYENYFVKSVKASSPTTRNFVSDLARNGLSLKSGEILSGVTVAITDGGASLKGKIVASEGSILPSRMKIHLIPVEPISADDLLRYAERWADNGSFVFTNLVPGKYWMLVRAVPESDQPELPATPTHWDAAERARLRREAEAANNVVELKPCQRLADQIFKYPVAVK